MDKKAIANTAARLRELLAVRPEYARLWQARIGRRQGHELHQSAICRVIAEYLVSNGMAQGSEAQLARSLKDRVYRALAGASLSRTTLRWFIEAFAMSPQDTASLLQLAAARSGPQTVVGGAVLAPGDLPPRRHRTVSLREFHRVGPDGLPESHRTQCEIVATEPLERYPYIFDTDAATVRVVRGGNAGAPYALDNGLFAVDIVLERPLQPGETAALEYETTFWYRTPPPPELRRASAGRIEDVAITVQFHHLRLPSAVWFSEWAALDAAPARSEPVELDADKAVHRRLPAIEATVVGFRWEIAARRG